MKIHKKVKIGKPEIGTFSTITSKVKGIYNEENMGFHLTPKNYYFRLRLGDENVIRIRA